MAVPLSAAVAAVPLPLLAVDFLFDASSFVVPLPFVVGALPVPFVVTDDEEDDGDGNDDGDAVSIAFSLLMCNLCSPFCSESGVGALAAAVTHNFEQYGFFLSFPDLPQCAHDKLSNFSGDMDFWRRFADGSSDSSE